MVGMTVAQHNCMEVLWLNLQNIHVVQRSIVSRSSVKENDLFFSLIVDGNKHGDAVLGSEPRTRKRIAAQGRTVSYGRACHKHVYGIVHYREDFHLIDGI
jgi:hypothetical protein